MQHNRSKIPLTTSEIRRSFFGVLSEESTASTAQLTAATLTASAKLIAREAKKKLAHIQEETHRTPSEEELTELIYAVEKAHGEELSERERTGVTAVLASSFDHYGILSPLIENPAINDIIISAFNNISIQTNRRNVQTDLTFVDHDSYVSFVENLLKRAGKECTTATPIVDAAVDRNVRACVTHESFSPPGSGPMVTLRVARHKEISLLSLQRSSLAPLSLLKYLETVVSTGTATVLIAGEVGTGKTTLARALAHTVPDEEAIVVIEDTHEIRLSRRFVRTLLTREANSEGAGKIVPSEAIRTGMRMAMNRIILGEMRDPDAALSFVDVCASGHAGLSTIHSRSARDAISRLELFLLRGQAGICVETIRRQIANAVGVIVHLGLDKLTHQRRIFEILEVGAYADGAVQIIPIFKFIDGNSEPSWQRESGISQYQGILLERRIVLSPPGSSISLGTSYLRDVESNKNDLDNPQQFSPENKARSESLSGGFTQ